MKIKEKKKINIWKYALLLLVAIIIGGSIFLYTRITENREPLLREESYKQWKADDPSFQVQITKEQVNKLINEYLDKFLDNSSIKYGFLLEEQALFTGDYEFFGETVTFYLYFEPYVLDNGNVLFKAKSLSIGTLEVPISTIMGYIKNHYSIPKWVEIDPKEETILFDLSAIIFKDYFGFQAKQIDLIENNILFDVYLDPGYFQ